MRSSDDDDRGSGPLEDDEPAFEPPSDPPSEAARPAFADDAADDEPACEPVDDPAPSPTSSSSATGEAEPSEAEPLISGDDPLDPWFQENSEQRSRSAS